MPRVRIEGVGMKPLDEVTARLAAANDKLEESLKRESARSLVARLDRENRAAEERRAKRSLFEVFRPGRGKP